MQVLVTGGGGFLGRAIVRQLTYRGEKVRVLGRSSYPFLDKLGVEVIQGDVRDPAVVNNACRDVELVFHTAAVAGIWGPWDRYHSINTVGTRNVIDACIAQGVQRLIYTSSPSVVFTGADQENVNETEPYPRRYLCHYPHSKALAEQEVLDSHDRTRLLTCALRPHLIWGPGDQHLIPRMLERARLEKLKRVGEGENKVDMIYVDNAAAAHLQAADALTPTSPVGGQAYFVSEGQPVNLWLWINEILMLAGLPRVRRSVSYSSAYTVGRILETMYEWFGWQDHEPIMTRFLACQLAHHHYYDVSKARRDFGMRPIVSFEEGMDRLGRFLSGETAIAEQTLPCNRSPEEVERQRQRQLNWRENYGKTKPKTSAASSYDTDDDDHDDPETDDNLYADPDDGQQDDHEPTTPVRDRLADGIEYADDDDENADKRHSPRGRR
ncbi:MAG: NAD-dependent epimerase/dehydratase family protein [Planctomycetaceae bacterium]|nr:NAD-dependent epimerase/dehydratase family protein [Planctomycetaceae bacterium]